MIFQYMDYGKDDRIEGRNRCPSTNDENTVRTVLNTSPRYLGMTHMTLSMSSLFSGIFTVYYSYIDLVVLNFPVGHIASFFKVDAA